MNVPIIPKYLFRHGIKPLSQGTQKLFPQKHGLHGLHLAGFDVETIGSQLFRKNDLYSVQVTADSPENTHIFFPKRQGVGNLSMFFEAAGVENGSIFASAHNAGFDIGALLGNDVYEFMQCKPVMGWKGKVVDGNTAFALLYNSKEKKRVTIADSMAWFKGSLKRVAREHFPGMEKEERPDFLGKRAPRNRRELDRFCAYAERDSVIQLELTKKIYSLCSKGNVKVSLTPAQLSGRVFQKHYLGERIFLPYWKKLPLIAKTYHGAQFTAFGRGFFSDVYYYDINSLYPYATITVPLNFSNTPYTSITLEDAENGMVGFCGVKFAFPEQEQYPCLPTVRKIRGFPKLVFPKSGISYCTTEELKLALGKGAEIYSMHGFGWYPAEKDVSHALADYMRDIYSEKERFDLRKGLSPAQRDMRAYYKLLLNSLIGKFCQRNREWLTGKEVAGSLFKPDFASLILSRSRAVINSLISRHGAIYSDTDCLITKKKLETGTGMGQLKNELGSGKGDLLSIRSKLYFVTKEGRLVKCAKHGFRAGSREVFAGILEKRARNSVVYSVERLTRLKEAYKRKRLPRREVSQTFRIMLADDGKRAYNERLCTVQELLSGNTFSEPLE